MKKLLTVIALTMLNPAIAADLNFNGTVATSCSLNINQPGTLAISPTNPSILSTAVSGGGDGIVAVSYIGTPTITVSYPTTFAVAPTLSFTPTFAGVAISSSLGSFSFSTGVGSKTYATGNNDNVTVGLQADGGSNAFPVGTYTAVVTVTCL